MTQAVERPVPAGAGGREKSPRRGFRADVQGLRAVAVLGVVADHFAGWPHGGFVGVDVFFVISGYLITGLLAREYDRTGTISFLGFYRRRIRRILPAALFVLAATLAAGYVLLGRDLFASLRLDAVAAALFVSNWRFAATGVDYFQQSLPPSPLQHYWSLSVEEQFYFVWPWLMVGVLWLGARHRSWRREHGRLVAGLLIGLLSLASLLYGFHATAHEPTVAYFSTWARACELGLGALVALAGPALRLGGARARTALAWLGLAAIVVAFLVVPSAPGFPMPWVLLPTVATALVLATGEGMDTRVWPLTNPVSRYLGEISYSLYLWHFPVAVLLVHVVAGHGPAYWILGTALMLGLSAASYHLLENPARTRPWLVGRHLSWGWARYAGGLAVLVVAAVPVHGLVVGIGPDALTVPAAVSLGRTAAAPGDCVGAADLDPAHHCAGPTPLGNVLAPAAGLVPTDTAGAYRCYALAGAPFQSCHYGPSDRSPARPLRVALVGDSHAAALLPALAPQLRTLGWSLHTFVGNGCEWNSAAADGNCARAWPHIEDHLVHGHFDVVLATERRHSGGATAADYRSAMAPVAATGARIVVVGDDPSVSPAAIDCVSRVGPITGRQCATPATQAYADPDQLAAAAAGVPGAVVVDTRRWFCPGSPCPAVIGNVVVYRDTAGHMTATYARTLSPYLAGALQAALSPRG